MDNQIFKAGDIFGLRYSGFFGAIASRIFEPKTDRYHFGIIGPYNELFDDYPIVESNMYGFLAKGVCHGWLSQYKGADIEVYEVPEEQQYLGDLVYWNTLNFQRVLYDVGLFFKIPISLLRAYYKQIFFEHRFRRIEAAELIYVRNKKFVCTEMANEAWWTFDYPIVQKGVTAIPSEFKRAVLTGRIKMIYKGNLTDVFTEVSL